MYTFPALDPLNHLTFLLVVTRDREGDVYRPDAVLPTVKVTTYLFAGMTRHALTLNYDHKKWNNKCVKHECASLLNI
jgi:hypothetical protein